MSGFKIERKVARTSSGVLAAVKALTVSYSSLLPKKRCIVTGSDSFATISAIREKFLPSNHLSGLEKSSAKLPPK